MGRKDRKPSPSATPPEQPRSWLRRHAFWLSLALIGVATIAAIGYFTRSADNNASATASKPTLQPVTPTAQKAFTLDKLLAMTPEQLREVDIAEMNLLCATGLPGAEDMNVEKSLAKLDQWAARVKAETERYLYRLTDPRYADHAEHFKHSEARFRAEWLMNILQKDIGVHYFAGMTRPEDPVVMPKTSKEHFIHGFMDNADAHKAFGGNCVSMPVVYAAVGRRLGYPIKLVCSLEHCFCRWEGLEHPNPAWRDRFNFDGAGDGFSIDPDEFYYSWPRKWDRDCIDLHDWMSSLTPRKELALFMAHRALVLREVSKDYGRALVAYSQAVRLWPENIGTLEEVGKTCNPVWAAHVVAHADTYRRKYGIEMVDGRVVPIRQAGQPTDSLAEMRALDEINRQNMQRMTPPAWPQTPGAIGVQPLGPRSPQPGVPQPTSPYGPYGPQPGFPSPYPPTGPGQPPR